MCFQCVYYSFLGFVFRYHTKNNMSSEALDLVCSVCSEIFVYRDTLLSHILDHHNDAQSLRCFTLKKLDSKSASILFHYYGNKYRCKTCAYKTEHRVLFEEHARCHMHELPYKCFWCSNDLAGHDLVQHFAKEHSRLRVRFSAVLHSTSMEKILKNLGPKAPLLVKPRVHRLVPQKSTQALSVSGSNDNRDTGRNSSSGSLQKNSEKASTVLDEPITIEDDEDDDDVAIVDTTMMLCISSVTSLNSCSQEQEGSSCKILQNTSCGETGAKTLCGETGAITLCGETGSKTSEVDTVKVEVEDVMQDMDMNSILVTVENDVENLSENDESNNGMAGHKPRKTSASLLSEDSTDVDLCGSRIEGSVRMQYLANGTNMVELAANTVEVLPDDNAEALEPVGAFEGGTLETVDQDFNRPELSAPEISFDLASVSSTGVLQQATSSSTRLSANSDCNDHLNAQDTVELQPGEINVVNMRSIQCLEVASIQLNKNQIDTAWW